MMLFALSSCIARTYFSWLPAYIRGVLRRREKHDGPVHVMFCFVDHFEPGWQRPDLEVERARVARWCHEYPALAARHQDADGQVPKHCFFYPEEEYREEHLRALSNLCAPGVWGDGNTPASRPGYRGGTAGENQGLHRQARPCA